MYKETSIYVGSNDENVLYYDMTFYDVNVMINIML